MLGAAAPLASAAATLPLLPVWLPLAEEPDAPCKRRVMGNACEEMGWWAGEATSSTLRCIHATLPDQLLASRQLCTPAAAPPTAG